MNETPATDTLAASKKKRGLFIPALVGLLTLILVGFFASRAGLDKALVKQQVDGFITMAQDKARERGRDLTITYRDLEVVGSFASKHVVVHNPMLVVKPLDAAPAPAGMKKPTDALQISTPSLEIYPESADLSSLRVLAPEPINFAGADEPDKSLLKIANNIAPVIKVAHHQDGEVNYSDVAYVSPSQMEFTYLKETQATGVEEKTPTLVPVYESLTITMAQGSGFTSSTALDGSGLGKAKLDMRDLVITPAKAPKATIKAPSIVGEWSNSLNDKKQNVMETRLDVGPITSDDVSLPYQPVTLSLDATYEGAMPKSAEAIASIQSQESSILLKKLTLSTKEASLNATANFTANAADALPVGTANVALSNVPFVLGELRKMGVLNVRNEPLVGAMLARITGKPLAEMTDLVIPVERIRGGAFKIGNTTFEELLTVLLGQAMQMRSAAPAPAPQLPDADKPRTTPMEVPDPSVRG